MNPHGNDLLLLAGKVLTIMMQAVMAIGAAALALALPVMILFKGDILEGLADGSDLPLDQIPLWPFAGIVLIAITILIALFVFFGKLRAIINTVGAGDPFVPENADRLNMMAWLLLAAQLMVIPLAGLLVPLAAWASQFEDEVKISTDVDGLDLTGILMVIILFILARVFRHGAAMRADLEGTV